MKHLCHGCRSELVPGGRFCHACGQPVAAGAGEPTAAPSEGVQALSEVLLCCEPHGLPSTQAEAALRQWQDVVGAVVRQAGGKPVEDGPSPAGSRLMFLLSGERSEVAAWALRVGLGVRDAVARTWRVSVRDQANGDTALSVGVSLHLAGAPGGTGADRAVGLHLLQLCLPGHLVVSAGIRLGSAQEWPWRDLGRIELVRSGAGGAAVRDSVQAYGLGAAAEMHRHSWAQRSLPYMIGREAELAALGATLGQSTDQPGRVVALNAEAGMGKSLLLAHFLRTAEYNQERIHVMSCSPDMADRERFPLVVWLEDMLGFDAEDESVARLEKVQARLPWFASREDALIVAQFLGVTLPPDVMAPNLTPLIAQQRLESLVRRWLVGDGPRQSILVVEDLHWCDPLTLAFLGSLANEPLVLVLSTRPVAESVVTAAIPSAQWMALPPQDAGEMRQLIARITQGKTLPPDMEQLLLAQSGGNPLYLEEFTRGALASGVLVEQPQRWEWAPGAQGRWNPADYRQALVERLDRLGTARSVAIHASVIGRRFDVGALAVLLPDSAAPDLAKGIDELVDAGMIEMVDPARGEYEFSHALVQMAAYESVMLREREGMHARLAAHIESELPEVAQRQPALVARHLAQAGDHERAVRRWLMAGQLSLSRSANAEAISYLKEGLSLLKHLPESVRDGLELALLTAMGPALIATTGFASPVVGQTFARTRELCDAFAEAPEVFPSLWGSWVFSLVRGRLRESRDYALRMRDLVGTMGTNSLSIEAIWTLGDSLYWMGDLATADSWLEQACQTYEPALHRPHATLFGQDPGVAANCYASLVLLHRGRPEAAEQALQRAWSISSERDHAFSTSWALAFRHMVAMYRRDAVAAVEASAASLRFCDEHGTPFWQASGQVVQGWGRVQLGEVAQGLEQMRAGMAMYEAIGSNVVLPLWHALRADALLRAGDLDGAAESVSRGLALATANEEQLSEAELWVAQGDVRLAQGGVEARDAAQSAYRHALALAQRMDSVLLAQRSQQRLDALATSQP